MTTHADVTIVGGGLAGLTLALQLNSVLPKLQVVLLEQKSYPVPETTHKVGESMVELSSWYLDQVLGLGNHLLARHLPKLGLRFFMTHMDNNDLGLRPEYGVMTFPDRGIQGENESFPGVHLRTYNVDLGRLENHLLMLCREAGVIVRDRCKVTTVDLGNPHRIVAHGINAPTGRMHSRWIVDATGRAGFLARQLGVRERQRHTVNAAWFRVKGRIDPDKWTDDQSYHDRMKADLRWMSTNHLMGHGYWVWLIPLRTGATSVGIMADPSIHSFGLLNRKDKAMAWMAAQEPQLGDIVVASDLLDFRRMRAHSYRSRKTLSADRWALSGESAYFLDALYSPGGDFIAVGNTLITQMIEADYSGDSRRLRACVSFGEELLSGMFRHYYGLLRQSYRLMGHPGAMLRRVAWDIAVYFAYNVLLFRNGRFCDYSFHRLISDHNRRLEQLQQRMLNRFEECDDSQRSYSGCFVDQSRIGAVQSLYRSSREYLDNTSALQEQLAENIATLELFSDTIDDIVA